MFETFFARGDTFTLGVCNGCQMLAALKSLIPGAAHWPRFVRNRGEQFEGRFSLVEVLPIGRRAAAGHGRLAVAGCRCAWRGPGGVRSDLAQQAALARASQIAVPVSSMAAAGRRCTYPANPNGSPLGIAAVTSTDGRVLITMPHPERSWRVVQNSWYPPGARRVQRLDAAFLQRPPVC